MTTPAIILVYDGDCPVCRNYTQHLSIKQAAGTFELLNAHDNPPIVQEINALNLDMDEGFYSRSVIDFIMAQMQSILWLS